MSIAEQISRITGNVDSAYQALEDRGADLPQLRNTANLRSTIESIEAGASSGIMPLDFKMHVGMKNANDNLIYGTDSLGNYYTALNVQEGEKYIISCFSASPTYPGAFYTLNGVTVSSVFSDNEVVHTDAEITVPSGVDTLWVNNRSSRLGLEYWKICKILSSSDYCEENNGRIIALEKEREDEQLESLRRLKNLESLYNFRWKPFDKAYYCFVNDGSKKWLHVFYDVFHQHNAPMCAATIGANIELKNDTETVYDRTVKQTLDLIVADGGEVMTYLNAERLESTDPYDLWYDYAVRNGKHMIESYGYKVRGLILSSQSARNSAVGQEICERFFDYADQVGIKNQYRIHREQFASNSTVNDVKQYIDNTCSTPGFYPIMMHGPYLEPWATSAGMDEILSYIEGKGSSVAEVTTYSDVFDRFGTNGFITINDLPVYNGGVE